MPRSSHKIRIPVSAWIAAVLTVAALVIVLIMTRSDDSQTPQLSDVDEFCRHAADREARGDTAGAVHYYRMALGVNPNHPVACYRFGMIGFARKAFPQAGQLFQKVLAQEPGHYQAAYQLALVFDKEQQPDSAIAWLARAIEIEPTFAMAHYSLGLLWLNQQQPDSAVKYLTNYVDSRPVDAQSAQEVQELIESIRYQR